LQASPLHTTKPSTSSNAILFLIRWLLSLQINLLFCCGEPMARAGSRHPTQLYPALPERSSSGGPSNGAPSPSHRPIIASLRDTVKAMPHTPAGCGSRIRGPARGLTFRRRTSIIWMRRARAERIRQCRLWFPSSSRGSSAWW
jgi:hypothetical protein